MKTETETVTKKGIVYRITTYFKDSGEFLANNIRRLSLENP